VVLAPPERLVGSQQPTHRLSPPGAPNSKIDAVLGLAELVQVDLYDWQKEFLADGLAVVHGVDAAGRAADKWASYQVGLELSRQNGKSVVFEMRCVAGLFLFREREIVYSAHKGETAMKAYNRIQDLIYRAPELLREIKRFGATNGKEIIETWDGRKLRFRTRTAGGGRGLSGDCVILDESQELVDEEIAALMPVVSAMPNAQLWYGGSAGTKKSTVQGRLIRLAERERPRLTYWRWAIGDDMDPDSPTTWARLNPAVGHTMTIEDIAAEHDVMSPQKFGEERLGAGDYPREEGEDWVIPRTAVEAAADEASKMVGPVLFGVEVKHDRTYASIAAAGRRSDGRKHFELVDNRKGATWAVGKLIALAGEHENLGVVIDPDSQAKNLIAPLEAAGVSVHLMKSAELPTAFSDMYDAMVPAPDDPDFRPQVFHTGGSLLVAHFSEAEVRTSHGALTWRRIGQADTTGVLASCWSSYKFDELETPADPPPSPLSVNEQLRDLIDRARGSDGDNPAHMGF
jgi:hypothetical protein